MYAAFTAVGWFASRKVRQGTAADLILAGRQMPLWIAALTMTATWVDGGYLLGTTEATYKSSVQLGIQGGLCFGVSLIVGGLIFADIMRRFGFTTLIDPFEARYGKRWTHALAINDIYFDYAAPVLTQAGLPDNAVSMLSAGDGSESAFLRIRAGTFQTGSVAEPLNLHGWQLVDEINRLFAGEHVTGYVFPVHLVTAENIASDGGPANSFDPGNGYRDAYKRIWGK